MIKKYNKENDNKNSDINNRVKKYISVTKHIKQDKKYYILYYYIKQFIEIKL